MRKFASIFLALALLLSVVGSIHADGEITVTADKVTGKFQQNITFSLEAQGSAADITRVTLYYQVGNQPVTSYAYPKFDAGRSIKAEHVWDTKKAYIPPGVTINYYYSLEDSASHQLKTERKSFLYTDTRHTWKSKTTGNLTLSWYQGSDSFGNDLFEAAKTALAQLEKDAGVSVQEPVSLWIYESYDELRSAMEQGAKEWTGGVSYSDMGVILIGIAESNLAWGKRAVSHELSHVVIDQATHNPFGDLPRWLNEGLAMYSEGPLESQYKTSLDRAVSQGKLLSLKTISSNFPADSNQATLSYAESYSVLKYPHRHLRPRQDGRAAERLQGRRHLRWGAEEGLWHGHRRAGHRLAGQPGHQACRGQRHARGADLANARTPRSRRGDSYTHVRSCPGCRTGYLPAELDHAVAGALRGLRLRQHWP